MERVLIIDDEPDYIKVVETILEKEGYDVIPATSGKEGLDKLTEERPDLILLDIMMPEMDGFEVCSRIRENFESLPVIILSVMKDDSDIVKGLWVGANDYFTKPFNKAILLAKIRSLLKFKKMEEQLKEYSEELEKKVDERTAELKEAHEKLKHEYWKLEKELDLAKCQMEHDEVKVGLVSGLTGVFAAVMLLSLIVLITTGNVYYLGLLLFTGITIAGLMGWYSRKRMRQTVHMVEGIKQNP
jgi:DNA-binding response OmpR family regulator